jgi:hypothetical protein
MQMWQGGGVVRLFVALAGSWPRWLCVFVAGEVKPDKTCDTGKQ